MQEDTQTVRGFLSSIRDRKPMFMRTAQEALQASDRQVSALYQRNSSASMRSGDVMKAIREEERRKREQQRTEPMDIADMYTWVLPAMPKTEDALEDAPEELDITEKAARIQVDDQTKRPDVLCFEIRDTLPTLRLVEEAVSLCLRETGKYPYAVVLSNLRYAAMHSAMRVTQGFYITQDITRIPYRQADGTADYDVMAVCEV
jgi:hypothetical protein